ncbi:conserved protein of unknown function [Streptococcus sanguinis]|uniref:Uncharacterized protein n=1 Tax=Streptococcus sanguinis TaxID=1305 RepID=A0A0B7GSH1_STRSA|nr:conserved protein of unknown function [Streptococcus sanguinis]
MGLMTQDIRVTDVKVELMIYLGILLTQIGTQFIKNIFEESVWKANILPYRDDNCCMLDDHVYRDF